MTKQKKTVSKIGKRREVRTVCERFKALTEKSILRHPTIYIQIKTKLQDVPKVPDKFEKS